MGRKLEMMNMQRKHKVDYGLLVMGIIFTVGSIILGYVGVSGIINPSVPSHEINNVPCYDNQGNVIEGLECIEETDHDTRGIVITSFIFMFIMGMLAFMFLISAFHPMYV
jgi:hypothetical protein